MANIEYFDNTVKTERVAMKVVLLGATGFVGAALLKEALGRGHVVTAIVRHPGNLEKHDGLTAKAGASITFLAIANADNRNCQQVR